MFGENLCEYVYTQADRFIWSSVSVVTSEVLILFPFFVKVSQHVYTSN